MFHLRRNSSAFKFFITLWSKHCDLQDIHLLWALKHVLVSKNLQKGDVLYFAGDSVKTIFLVTKGALGRTTIDDKDNRLILNVAFAGMPFMTTKHLYSSTPIQGDIEVLHPGTEVLTLSYASLFKFREDERCVDTLISILGNKEKTQRDLLHIINRNKSPFKRGLLLAEQLPEIFYGLFQYEIAQLLDTSRTTVQSVCRHLARKK